MNTHWLVCGGQREQVSPPFFSFFFSLSLLFFPCHDLKVALLAWEICTVVLLKLGTGLYLSFGNKEIKWLQKYSKINQQNRQLETHFSLSLENGLLSSHTHKHTHHFPDANPAHFSAFIVNSMDAHFLLLTSLHDWTHALNTSGGTHALHLPPPTLHVTHNTLHQIHIYRKHTISAWHTTDTLYTSNTHTYLHNTHTCTSFSQ